MTLISMDRFGMRQSGASADEVLVGWPIPSESTLVGLDAKIHIIGSTAVGLSTLVAYGLDAYVIPLLDPDAHDDLDLIWDELVPKTTQDITFELSDVADQDPVWEPGELQSEYFTGIQVGQAEEIYTKRKFLSAAESLNGTYDRTAHTWFPMDFVTMKISKKYFTPTESAILIGISTPALDRDTSDNELLPGAVTAEWILMKYIDRTMEQVMDLQTGLFTEGTGTFGLDEAENFIEDLVSDWNVVDAALFVALVSDNFATGNARVRVPGIRTVKTVAPGN